MRRRESLFVDVALLVSIAGLINAITQQSGPPVLSSKSKSLSTSICSEWCLAYQNDIISCSRFDRKDLAQCIADHPLATVLDLSYVNVDRPLSADSFSGLDQVVTVYLDGSRFRAPIDRHTLNGMPRLRTVFMRRMRTPVGDLLPALVSSTSVRQVAVAENFVVCSCDWIDAVTKLADRDIAVIDWSSAAPSCTEDHVRKCREKEMSQTSAVGQRKDPARRPTTGGYARKAKAVSGLSKTVRRRRRIRSSVELQQHHEASRQRFRQQQNEVKVKRDVEDADAEVEDESAELSEVDLTSVDKRSGDVQKDRVEKNRKFVGASKEASAANVKDKSQSADVDLVEKRDHDHDDYDDSEELEHEAGADKAEVMAAAKRDDKAVDKKVREAKEDDDGHHHHHQWISHPGTIVLILLLCLIVVLIAVYCFTPVKKHVDNKLPNVSGNNSQQATANSTNHSAPSTDDEDLRTAEAAMETTPLVSGQVAEVASSKKGKKFFDRKHKKDDEKKKKDSSTTGKNVNESNAVDNNNDSNGNIDRRSHTQWTSSSEEQRQWVAAHQALGGAVSGDSEAYGDIGNGVRRYWTLLNGDGLGVASPWSPVSNSNNNNYVGIAASVADVDQELN